MITGRAQLAGVRLMLGCPKALTRTGGKSMPVGARIPLVVLAGCQGKRVTSTDWKYGYDN